MNRKIIFLDCDGTLFDVPRGMPHASYATKYAIKELIDSGHIVYIASGRCKCIIPQEIIDLKPTGYITSNGAYCYENDKVIYCENVDQNLVKKVVDYCNENNGVYFLEGPNEIYTKDLNDSIYIGFVTTWGINTDCFIEDNGIIRNCQMMMNAFASDEDCDKFYDEFKDILDVRKQYGYTSFDISQKGIDKGTGVEKILEYYGIDKEDAYAFGDGLNDIEMIKSVGNGYAMANGHNECKQAAKYIAPDVLEDGFYKVMVETKLIKPID